MKNKLRDWLAPVVFLIGWMVVSAWVVANLLAVQTRITASSLTPVLALAPTIASALSAARDGREERLQVAAYRARRPDNEPRETDR